MASIYAVVTLLTAQPNGSYTLYVSELLFSNDAAQVQIYDPVTTIRGPNFQVDNSTLQTCFNAYFLTLGQLPPCAASMQYLYMFVAFKSFKT